MYHLRHIKACMGLCFARKFHERTQDQLSKCFSRIPSRSPDFEGNKRNELSLASVRFETSGRDFALSKVPSAQVKAQRKNMQCRFRSVRLLIPLLSDTLVSSLFEDFLWIMQQTLAIFEKGK